MAVKPVVINPKKFIGLSGDTKPADLQGAGHKFTELDTGKAWIYNGTTWVADLEMIYAVKTGVAV